MKIKMIKFYAGVVLGDNSGTLGSFTPDEAISHEGMKKGLKAELTERGVMLYSKTGAALVPWNNVAYVQYTPEEVKPESKAPKSK